MHDLVFATLAAPSWFHIRRVLQRLERGEIDLQEALRALCSA
jgi:hypothetical protein